MERVKKSHGVGLVHARRDLVGRQPSDRRRLRRVDRRLALVPAAEHQRDDPTADVLVDAGQWAGLHEESGLLEDLADQALVDAFVELEDPAGWFPLAVVTPLNGEEPAVIADDRGGDAHGVAGGTHAVGSVTVARRPVDRKCGAKLTQTIDPTSDRPVYRQIADHLRDAIASGELRPGDQLPSETKLIERYGAARGTVREAVAILRTEGLIEVEHGRGAFVRVRPPIRRLAQDRFARKHRKAGRAAFLAEAQTEGWTPQVEVLDVGPTTAAAEVAARLEIEAGSDVLRRHRRYLADGQPVEVATSWLPLELVKGTAICETNPGPGGIYARLEELGHTLDHFTEEVEARMPSPDETRLLRLPPGTPVFRLVRAAHSKAGRIVEICDTVMAADHYVLSYRLPAS